MEGIFKSMSPKSWETASYGRHLRKGGQCGTMGTLERRHHVMGNASLC